jgi:hypothetical protein
MQFLQMMHFSFVAIIALHNLSYSALEITTSNQSHERLFLVTHCLPALYKGPIQWSVC